MGIIDKKLLNEAIERFIKYAEGKRETAGYSGAWDDGGYCDMMNELEAYQVGLRGGIPEFLQEHYTLVSKEQDPEYAKYLELQAKFGDE